MKKNMTNRQTDLLVRIISDEIDKYNEKQISSDDIMKMSKERVEKKYGKEFKIVQEAYDNYIKSQKYFIDLQKEFSDKMGRSIYFAAMNRENTELKDVLVSEIYKERIEVMKKHGLLVYNKLDIEKQVLLNSTLESNELVNSVIKALKG
jgi:hypothetical protein